MTTDHRTRPDRGAAAIRLVPAPVVDPPYDDEVPEPASSGLTFGATRRATRPVAVQGSLALDFVLPSGLPVVPRPAPRLRIVGRDLGRARPRPVPDESEALRPAPGPWAAMIVQAAVEVVAGDRPLSQLTRWTTAEVYEQLQWRRRAAGRSGPRAAAPPPVVGPRAVVTSVHVCEPGTGVAEACATVRRGDRVAAVALRLEADRSAWRCTALELR